MAWSRGRPTSRQNCGRGGSLAAGPVADRRLGDGLGFAVLPCALESPLTFLDDPMMTPTYIHYLARIRLGGVDSLDSSAEPILIQHGWWRLAEAGLLEVSITSWKQFASTTLK